MLVLLNVTILTFVILTVLMWILHLLYIKRESFYALSYENPNTMILQSEIAETRWNTIDRYDGQITLEFALRVNNDFNQWVNIFQGGDDSNKSHDAFLKQHPNQDPADIPWYDGWQDMYRRPGIYIRNKIVDKKTISYLHITRSTRSNTNDWFDVNLGELRNWYRIRIAWYTRHVVYRTESYPITYCIVEVNRNKTLYVYKDPELLANDANDTFFINRRFQDAPPNVNIELDGLRIYNEPLTDLINDIPEPRFIINSKRGNFVCTVGNELTLSRASPLFVKLEKPPKIYRSESNRTAIICLNNGIYGNSIRHFGLVLRTNYKFVENNYDFSWYFTDCKDGTVRWANDYEGVTYVGLDGNLLRIFKSDDQRANERWIISPRPASGTLGMC